MGSIAAVILGYIALRQIRREPLRLKGRGMAIVGIALGWLGMVGLAVLISLGIHFWKMRGDNSQKPRTQPVHLTTTAASLIGCSGRSFLLFAVPISALLSRNLPR
jgi:hypothetical protein